MVLINKVIFLIMLLLLSCFAYSVSLPYIANNTVCYDWENNYNDYFSKITPSVIGSPTFISGVDGLAVNFSGTAQAVNLGSDEVLNIGSNDYTMCAYLDMHSIAGDIGIFSRWGFNTKKQYDFRAGIGTVNETTPAILTSVNGANDATYTYGAKNYATTNYSLVCFVRFSGKNYVYVDGVLGTGTADTGTYYWSTAVNGTLIAGMPILAGNTYGPLSVDTTFFIKGLGYNSTLLTSLYDTGSFKSCDEIFANATNNPPQITNVIQNPTNATVLSIVNQSVNISATITDTDLNISTIRLELLHNNSHYYLNGSEIDMNENFSYIAGSTYKWTLDESDLISGTYNVYHGLMENTTHDYEVLNNLNSYVKMEFYNVSGNTQLKFFEIYDENASTTDIARYYYCNSSYTTGNPTISNSCTLFASIDNNLAYNHLHLGLKSKHRILSLPVNTSNGKINGVFVTPVSYILKRGNSAGERYYYINYSARNGATQISSNNGNTWTSNNNIVVDSHIHSSYANESWRYRICAKDNASQETCSSFNNEFTDFPLLPPIAVNIYSPVASNYNGTILISHSESLSPNGFAILNYSYYYSKNGAGYVYIATNTHPTTNYSWDISDLMDANYTLKILTFDSYGMNSTTYSEKFQIVNEKDLDTQLLLSIDDTLNDIYGEIKMIPVIMLYAILTAITYYLAKNRNVTLALAMSFVCFGFDLLFIQWLYDAYVAGADLTIWQGQFLWIFGVMLYVLAVTKLVSVFFWKNRQIAKV